MFTKTGELFSALIFNLCWTPHRASSPVSYHSTYILLIGGVSSSRDRDADQSWGKLQSGDSSPFSLKQTAKRTLECLLVYVCKKLLTASSLRTENICNTKCRALKPLSSVSLDRLMLLGCLACGCFRFITCEWAGALSVWGLHAHVCVCMCE